MTSSFCSLCVSSINCINCDNIVAMKKYNDKISNFLSYISYKQYLFDVTKCCGYSEFIAIYKDYTLCELYKNISLHFEQPINNLFVINKITDEKKQIPNNANITIRQFISSNSDFFKPEYPINANVVYKIYFDYGPCHTHTNPNCVIHT